MKRQFVLFNENVFILLAQHKKGYWIAMNVLDGKTGMIKTSQVSPCFYPIIN